MIVMARKYEFKPDKPRNSLLAKLLLTEKQRRSLLKWLLYTLMLVVLSVLQDVLLCSVRIFGATTELVPCGIFLICLAEGMEKGCVFALIASCLYLFSGTAAGYYSIVFLTFYSVLITYFRQALLKKGFAAATLCTGVGLVAYEMSVFFVGLFLSMTTMARIGGFFLTAVLTCLTIPALYPVVRKISEIGGEAWKE